MTLQQRVIRRKIGVFELLVGALPVEFIFGTTSRALLLGILAALFFFAKREFKGEFSLLEAFELFTKASKEPSK